MIKGIQVKHQLIDNTTQDSTMQLFHFNKQLHYSDGKTDLTNNFLQLESRQICKSYQKSLFCIHGSDINGYLYVETSMFIFIISCQIEKVFWSSLL